MKILVQNDMRPIKEYVGMKYQIPMPIIAPSKNIALAICFFFIYSSFVNAFIMMIEPTQIIT